MAEPPRIDPLPEADWDPELRALIEQTWEGPPRHDGNNLFRTLARRPDLLQPWGEFGKAVYNGRLLPRERELLVLRVAWLTRCRFAWAFHEPLARRIGISPREIVGITRGPAAGWEAREACLLRAVDELHETSRIGDATWAELARWYDQPRLIEIPLVVGAYTLVAQLANALRVAPWDHLPALPPLPDPASQRSKP